MALTPGCALFKVYDPFYGTIIDEETQKPISGAVVLAEYTTVLITLAGGVTYNVWAEETVSDDKGTFRLPYNLITTFRPFHMWEPYPYIHIMKQGYGCFENMHSIIKKPMLKEKDDSFPWWSLPSRTDLVIAIPNNDVKKRRKGCDYLGGCANVDVNISKGIPCYQMKEFEKARKLEELRLTPSCISLTTRSKHFVELALTIASSESRKARSSRERYTSVSMPPI